MAKPPVKAAPENRGKSSDASASTLEATELLTPATVEVLQDFGIDTRNPELVQQFVSASLSLSRSPWPSPDMLAQYENFRPGLSESLIQEIRRQTEHRQSLELLKVQGSERRQYLALWTAFFVAMSGILAAALGSLVGAKPMVLMVIVIAAIGGPSVALILARLLNMKQ